MRRNRPAAALVTLLMAVSLLVATTESATADVTAGVSDWAYDEASNVSSFTLTLSASQSGQCSRDCVIVVELGHLTGQGSWASDFTAYRQPAYASTHGQAPWNFSSSMTVSGPAQQLQRATHYRAYEVRDAYPEPGVGWIEFQGGPPVASAALILKEWTFDSSNAQIDYSFDATFSYANSTNSPCTSGGYCSQSIILGRELSDGSVRDIQSIYSSTDYTGRFPWVNKVDVSRQSVPDLHAFTHARSVISAGSAEVTSPWARLPQDRQPPAINLHIDKWEIDAETMLVDYELEALMERTFSVAGSCQGFCADSIEAAYQASDGTWIVAVLTNGYAGRYPWTYTSTASREDAPGLAMYTHVRAVMQPLFNTDETRVLKTPWQPLKTAGLRIAEINGLLSGMSPTAFCDALVFVPKAPGVQSSTVDREVLKCYAGARAGQSTQTLVYLLVATPVGAGMVWALISQLSSGATTPPTPGPGDDPKNPRTFPDTPPTFLPSGDSFDAMADVQGLADHLERVHPGLELKLTSEEHWRTIARQCLWYAGQASLPARDRCEVDPIFISGRDFDQVTDHSIEALAGIKQTPNGPSQTSHWQLPPPTVETLTPPASLYRLSGVDAWPAWVQQNWEGGEASGKPNRGWYRPRYQGYAHPGCDVSRRPIDQCDEFPNFSSEQGGRPAERTPHMTMINGSQNETHGGVFGAGASSCKLEGGDPPVDRNLANSSGGSQFLYIPVDGSAVEDFPTLWLCNRG